MDHSERKWRLTAAELACCVAVVRGEEQGCLLLQGQYGKLTPEMLEGMFLAASHGLVARGLLTQGPKPTLVDDIETVIRTVTQPTRTLKAEHYADAEEKAASVHFGHSWPLLHTIEEDVLHVLQPFEDEPAATSALLRFLNVPQNPETFQQETLLVPLRSLQRITATNDTGYAKAQFQIDGCLSPLADDFALDIGNKPGRGLLLLLNYHNRPEHLVTRTWVTIHGDHRFWVFNPPTDANPDRLVAIKSTDRRHLLRELVTPATSSPT